MDTKKQQSADLDDEPPLSLAMTFDEALELLVNTPLPDDCNESSETDSKKE